MVAPGRAPCGEPGRSLDCEGAALEAPGIRMVRAAAAALVWLAAAALAAAPVEAGKAAQARTDSFRHLNEGVAAYNRGDVDEAVEKLSASAAVALNSYRAHYYLGLALHAQRRYDAAVEALRIALDLDPGQLLAHIALGDSLLKRGDTDEAMASFYRALKMRSEYPQALDGIARVHETRAEPDEAARFYRRAIASNRGFAEAYVHFGDMLLRAGRTDEAVGLLVEAVTVRPDYAPGLNRLALAYDRLGLRNEAVATIRKAIALQPKSAEHRTAMGTIQLSLGLLQGAEKAFREALEIDRLAEGAREGLAEVCRRRGDYEGAIAELDRAAADEVLDPATRQRLGSRRAALLAERDRVSALEALHAAGTASPADLRALAAILAGRQVWDRAADLMQAAAPEGGDRERLAYYLIRAGRFREAQALYEELARGAARPDLDTNAGIALARLGDDEGAIAAYRRALSRDGSFSPARLYLGNALARTGRRAEAAEAYRAFLEIAPEGEAAERARRVLARLDPSALAPGPAPPTRAPAPTDPDSGGERR